MTNTSSSAILLKGQPLKDSILKNLKEKINSQTNQPCLAVILIGNDPASHVYVSMKTKTCKAIGMQSRSYILPESTSQSEIEQLITKLNNDNSVHGILLQLPLPKHMNDNDLLSLIHPLKDVDGFHPKNIGNLLLGRNAIKPCTPYGICKLLDYYNIQTEGKHVVVVGRSNIVGKPIAALLLQNSTPGNATVTVCHSKTKNLTTFTKMADILILAIGQAQAITSDMIKDQASIIDVGINRLTDPKTNTTSLVGDVDYASCVKKASSITPVPGGVGPTTIAMLMNNTYESFLKLQRNS